MSTSVCRGEGCVQCSRCQDKILARTVEFFDKRAIEDLRAVLIFLAGLTAHTQTLIYECISSRKMSLHPTVPATRLLSVQEASNLSGLSTHWLYDHADELPFTRRLSRKCLRFEERLMKEWMAHNANRE